MLLKLNLFFSEKMEFKVIEKDPFPKGIEGYEITWQIGVLRRVLQENDDCSCFFM